MVHRFSAAVARPLTSGILTEVSSPKSETEVNSKMQIRGRQIAAARELLGQSQADLAHAIGVARQTISSFEAGINQPYPRTLDAMRTELERRGIEFTNGDGIGVRLIFAKAEAAARGDGAGPQR
mgnify:FL=1